MAVLLVFSPAERSNSCFSPRKLRSDDWYGFGSKLYYFGSITAAPLIGPITIPIPSQRNKD